MTSEAATGQPITNEAGHLQVPNHPIIPFIEGDGTGPDIWRASQRVFDAAVDKAYAGDGPTLIEAITYRMTDHTTADDASRYRDDAQTSRHWKQEPVARLKRYLSERFEWTKQEEEASLESARERVEEAARLYLEAQTLPATAMFDHLYERLPTGIADQRAEVTAGRPGEGRKHD